MLGIVVGATALGQYIGGVLFTHMQKLPKTSANVFTLYDYWRAYGDVPEVRRALRICTLLSVLIGCLPVVIVVMALAKTGRRIAQFGDARFASRRDIEKAGLLEKR
jgi:type IV secretion system protein VirD4